VQLPDGLLSVKAPRDTDLSCSGCAQLRSGFGSPQMTLTKVVREMESERLLPTDGCGPASGRGVGFHTFRESHMRLVIEAARTDVVRDTESERLLPPDGCRPASGGGGGCASSRCVTGGTPSSSDIANVAESIAIVCSWNRH